MTQADRVHSTQRKMAPKIDRSAIMARAWTIFRTIYKYPSIKFSSIGWKCFGSCVRKAWAEAKEAASIAAFPAPEKAARIVALQDTIRFAPFNESWAQASREISSARGELARLSA
jgi:hypothetical protein